MIHEKSGIEIDFDCDEIADWPCDYVTKSEREGISIEEIIEGRSFGGTYTYREDGYIYSVSFDTVSTDELIEQQNGNCGGFMDELSSIDVDEAKLKKIREGAKAEEVLTPEEIKQISDLVDEHIALSFIYADKEIIYDPDAEEI